MAGVVRFSSQHFTTSRRVSARALVVAVWALGAALSREVRAQEPGWSAPAACPDAAVVASKVRVLLQGHDFESEQLARFSGRITRSGGDEPLWVLRLSLGEGVAEKERVMEAARCEDLGDAAALAMALAIDPDLALPRASEASPDVAPSSKTTPAAQAEARPAVAPLAPQAPSALAAPPAGPARASQAPVMPVPTPNAANPQALPPAIDQPSEVTSATDANELGVSVLVALGVDAGALPKTAAGFFGALVLSTGSQRFELGGGVTPSTASEPAADAAYATFSLYRGKLSACHNPFDADTGLFACASLEGGAFWARGHEVDDAHTQTVPWFAPGAGLLALGRLAPRVSLDVRAEVLVPLSNDRFELDGAPVHQIPSVVFRGDVGVDFRFH